MAHRSINFLRNRHSGIALSSHLTAPKFSPALIVLFNWIPSWLLPRVIVETGCLLCRLHPAASNSTMRQSGLQLRLGLDLCPAPLPMWLAGRRSRSAQPCLQTGPWLIVQTSHAERSRCSSFRSYMLGTSCQRASWLGTPRRQETR